MINYAFHPISFFARIYPRVLFYSPTDCAFCHRKIISLTKNSRRLIKNFWVFEIRLAKARVREREGKWTALKLRAWLIPVTLYLGHVSLGIDKRTSHPQPQRQPLFVLSPVFLFAAQETTIATHFPLFSSTVSLTFLYFHAFYCLPFIKKYFIRFFSPKKKQLGRKYKIFLSRRL